MFVPLVLSLKGLVNAVMGENLIFRITSLHIIFSNITSTLFTVFLQQCRVLIGNVRGGTAT